MTKFDHEGRPRPPHKPTQYHDDRKPEVDEVEEYFEKEYRLCARCGQPDFHPLHRGKDTWFAFPTVDNKAHDFVEVEHES